MAAISQVKIGWPDAPESPAGSNRYGWPDAIGTGGRITPECAAKIRIDAAGIEVGSDPALGLSVFNKLAVDVAYDLDLLGGAGGEDNTVGLQALVLAARQFALPAAILTNQNPAQAEPCRATLPISQLDQAALTCKDFN